MGKVSSYTTVAAIADADLLYLAQDDSGDFLDRKITGQFLKSLFATAAQGDLADSAVQPGDPISINAQTGTTYTLVLGDAGKLVTLSNAGAITLTVPLNSSVAFPIGTRVELQQLGAGAISVAGATGVTINGTTPGSESLTDGQYTTTATLTKHAADMWTLTGNVA